MLLLIAALCVLSLCVTARSLRRRDRDLSRDADPWPMDASWRDEADVMEAITDPNLPLRGYERTEIAHEPEPVADTVIFGRIVDEDHWAEEAVIPAPAIEANPVHVQKALEWIAQWEREDNARLALAGVA